MLCSSMQCQTQIIPFFAINLILLIGIKWFGGIEWQKIDRLQCRLHRKKNNNKAHRKTLRWTTWTSYCTTLYNALIIFWRKKIRTKKIVWNNQTQISGMLIGCVCVWVCRTFNFQYFASLIFLGSEYVY